MNAPRLSMGILDEIKKHWTPSWKIILLFICSFLASLNVMWQHTISNPLIEMSTFWTFLSIVGFAYFSAAIVLVYKFSQVKLESLIIKLLEENVRTRDVAEACLQWVAAKPDQIGSVLEAIRKVNTWNYTNEQIKYIYDLEKKLESMVNTKKKEE